MAGGKNPIDIAPRTLLFSQRQRAEAKYFRLLKRLFREVNRRVGTAPTPEMVRKVLLDIAMSPQFDDLCREAARQIVTQLAVGQKATWRAAAAESSQGRRIYLALMNELSKTAIGQAVSEMVEENAALIKTVPYKISEKITDLVKTRRFEGVRPEDIMDEIREMAPHLSEVEARRIARTESSKASTALIKARAESLGLDFYIWRTARDGERVRKSHRIMEGVICKWSDPPNPEALAGEKSYGSYHPGGIFNCRCIPLPVVSVDDIQFPCKIYSSGRIRTVRNLNNFKSVMHL